MSFIIGLNSKKEVCLIDTLGERIRKLRKQKSLTLEALAGDQLTKGMLSLIENGKANPSMESLNYIAQQLDVDTTELLEEVSSTELRELLEQVEELYKVKFEDLTVEIQQVIALIKPYADKLPLTYESARLLDLYSRSLFSEKLKEWQHYFDRSIEMYSKLNFANQRAKMIFFFAMTKYTEHQYAEALKIIIEERKHLEKTNVLLDPIIRLEIDYYETILYFATGESEKARVVMNNAIKFSRERRIFYLTDDLYRMAAFNACITKNDQDREYYSSKLKHYAAFADHKLSEIFCNILEAHYYNSYAYNFEKALNIIDTIFNEPKIELVNTSFLYPEKGKALYGLGKTEEALFWFEQHKIPPYLHHPFDLSMQYEIDSYKSLCYLKLGRNKDALHHAKLASENIASMPHTPYKDFVNETLVYVEHKVSGK